ncbi:MAG: F0F1 ATP synthase subunit A [Acidobacteriota bacterium]|jgi:F-type H+-transporting ATPase subunit a|nr:F0F1 ATP synthase subunit A [Acidobacteriota bacterium]
MEEHKLIIVDWVNGLLRGLLGLFGIHPENHDLIPSHVVMALLVTALLITLFRLGSRRFELFPSRLQALMEMIYRGFRSLVDDVIGPEGRRFIPALGTVGLFIASCNLLGLLPELASPTANLNVTVGCAVFIFIYYHYQGVRRHGLLKYMRSFAGPVWWMAPLFVPIEVISHFSRPLSLSMRLFGNIFGEDLVIIIIASLVPFIAPLPMMGLAVFTSLLQAFIFVMLSAIYLAGAMESEH